VQEIQGSACGSLPRRWSCAYALTTKCPISACFLNLSSGNLRTCLWQPSPSRDPPKTTVFERVLDPVPRLMLDIEAWCAAMYSQHGTPNEFVSSSCITPPLYPSPLPYHNPPTVSLPHYSTPPPLYPSPPPSDLSPQAGLERKSDSSVSAEAISYPPPVLCRPPIVCPPTVSYPPRCTIPAYYIAPPY